MQFRRESKLLSRVEFENSKIEVQSLREMEKPVSKEIVAYYRSNIVKVHYSSKRDIDLTRKDLIELVKVRTN